MIPTTDAGAQSGRDDANLFASLGLSRSCWLVTSLASEQRQAVRHEQSKPVVDDLRAWRDAQLAKVPRRGRIAEAIRYALKLWSGLRLFLDYGRIEIDTNVVERAIRPIALNRKNALFAGSDQGGVHWGVIASLIEICKLNAVDPQFYLADILTASSIATPPAGSTSSCPGPTLIPWPKNSAYREIASDDGAWSIAGARSLRAPSRAASGLSTT